MIPLRAKMIKAMQVRNPATMSTLKGRGPEREAVFRSVGERRAGV